LKPLHVLIVDDSEQDTILLVRHLRNAGFSITNQRVDTAVALEKALTEQHWDIILCDYVMPTFSGLAALALSRKINPNLPFIVVSGQIGEDTAIEALRAGANDYIMKENLKRLTPAIERELGEAASRRQRREAEEALKVAEQELAVTKKVDALKDEFIGMVSHELKTPLTVIIGALNVAMTENIPQEEVKTLITDAAASAEALSSMVENLLELSREQSQRLSLHSEKTQIEPIVRRVVDKLKGTSPNNRFIIDLPAKLPQAIVDPIRIERVVYNLVENAIKYSPQGGEIRIYCTQRDTEIVVGVTDHGIGISPEDKRRLFQRFQRLEVQKKYDIGGVGLGLRVCRILVEAHGGRIWLESELGKGSTFFFSIPLSRS
jgi:signal transduction histidine kinase